MNSLVLTNTSATSTSANRRQFLPEVDRDTLTSALQIDPMGKIYKVLLLWFIGLNIPFSNCFSKANSQGHFSKCNESQMSSFTKCNVSQISSFTKCNVSQMSSFTKCNVSQMSSFTKCNLSQMSSFPSNNFLQCILW